MAIALESNSVSRMSCNHNSHVQRIREALGAVAAREPAVFWLYEDRDGAWCVRREGDEIHQRGTLGGASLLLRDAVHL